MNKFRHSYGVHAALLKISAALFLLALTFTFFHIVDRFDVVATNIIPNLSFENGIKHWSGSPKGVALKNKPLPVIEMRLAPNPKPLVLIRSIPASDQYSHIQIGADIKINGVKRGAKWWKQAGVILRNLDARGRKITFWPYKVAQMSGTDDWRRYTATLPVSERAKRMQLFFFLDGHAGSMDVTNITVDGLVPTAWAPFGTWALIAAWGFLGLWIFTPLVFADARNILVYLALAAFCATLVAVLTPQPLLYNTTTQAFQTVSSMLKPSVERPHSVVVRDTSKTATPKVSKPLASPSRRSSSSRPFKIANMTPQEIISGGGAAMSHIVSHAAFAFFTILAFSAASRGLVFASLFIAAAITEALQTFVITRSTNWDDFAMNLTGVAVGVTVGYIYLFIRQKWTAQTNSTAS
jgi:hypothetical protein